MTALSRHMTRARSTAKKQYRYVHRPASRAGTADINPLANLTKGIMEVWTEKLEERNWKEFEYEWATAASAPGREVADNLYNNTPDGEGEGEDESAPETTGDGEK